MGADYRSHGNVAVITLNNPPVNGLNYDTRRGVVDGLDKALADPSIHAIVVSGAGKAFSAGADIREFDTPKAWMEPNLHTLIRALETSAKPVIAAIHTVCMGGGLELALGCSYRVVTRGTQIAFPEVKLGLLPGAGGTQRLPRLVGVETALNMIVSGDTIQSEQLAGTRLFDEVIEGDLLDGALSFAERTLAEGRGIPKVRDIEVDYPNADGYFEFARNTVKTVAKNFPAPLKCVDAVEASVKCGFTEGLERERKLFLELMQTSESKALRHAFFAERAASKVPDIPEGTPARPLARAAVIGAGTMGGGIAMNFLNAGIPVTLLELNEEALDRGIAAIRRNYESSVKKGKLTQDKYHQRMRLLSKTLDYADVADADIAVEAVFEDIEIKRGVFEKLDEVMKPGSILATNTSTLDVNRIAGFTRRPQDVIGTHFFSPAHVMKLLEVVRGAATAKETLATVMKMAKTMRKIAVVSGVCDGFIGNRMLEQYWRQAGFLLEEGCTPEQVDQAIEKFGFAMGPFRMSDMAGNDVSWYIRKRRYVERPGLRYSKTADLLCELGRFGQKTGAGWYDYKPGDRNAYSSPVVTAIIERVRKELGMKERTVGEEEIIERLVYALVNEASLILEEGIAQRASDIDVVYLTGYGFPLWRGGPLCFADTVGLYNVLRSMNRFAANPYADPDFWKPAGLLSRLAAEGRTFN
jgi:3-hydroxyacyl-CoA dehydrogenase